MHSNQFDEACNLWYFEKWCERVDRPEKNYGKTNRVETNLNWVIILCFVFRCSFWPWHVCGFFFFLEIFNDWRCPNKEEVKTHRCQRKTITNQFFGPQRNIESYLYVFISTSEKKNTKSVEITEKMHKTQVFVSFLLKII